MCRTMKNKSSKQIVDSYGLHQGPDGIWWLLEQGVGLNAFGLSEKDCPFRIKTHLLMCNHKFNLLLARPQQFDLYEKMLKKSEILKFLDPATTPSNKILYVETDDATYFQTIVLAQELLNPTVTCSTASDFLKEGAETIARRLNSSPLSTYFVFGMNENNLHHVQKLASIAMSARGRLVIAGSRIPMTRFAGLAHSVKAEPELTKILNFIGKKALRDIGSFRLKQFMRS